MAHTSSPSQLYWDLDASAGNSLGLEANSFEFNS
jgi:hypothetical protein